MLRIAARAAMIEYSGIVLWVIDRLLALVGLVRAKRKPDAHVDAYFSRADQNGLIYLARIVVNNAGADRIELRGIELVTPKSAEFIELAIGDVNARAMFKVARRFRRIDCPDGRVSLQPGKRFKVERYVDLVSPAPNVSFKIESVIMTPKGEVPRAVNITRPVRD